MPVIHRINISVTISSTAGCRLQHAMLPAANGNDDIDMPDVHASLRKPGCRMRVDRAYRALHQHELLPLVLVLAGTTTSRPGPGQNSLIAGAAAAGDILSRCRAPVTVVSRQY